MTCIGARGAPGQREGKGAKEAEGGLSREPSVLRPAAGDRRQAAGRGGGGEVGACAQPARRPGAGRRESETRWTISCTRARPSRSSSHGRKRLGVDRPGRG